jgi:hypothetical protein
MNSSAKTTAVSFLAAVALGAAVLVGCTIESGTVDDTDTGTRPGDKDKDKDSGTPDDKEKDSGTPETGVAPTCTANQKSVFVDDKCQACLSTKCCTELKSCFDVPADPAAGTVDCNEYTACIDEYREECNAKPTQDERDECFAICDTTAAAGVKEGYESIVTCAESSCAAECGGN